MKKGRYFTMRKILALVLAIATLAVLAVLPVSAARPTGVYTDGVNSGASKFDGTTPNMSLGSKLNNPNGDLIVTEFLIDSTISDVQATDPGSNCYNYIEIYNRGTTTVNLTNVAIVGIYDNGFNSYWDNNADFKTGGGKAYIDAGKNIYDGNGDKIDGKYIHTGLTDAQANTNRYDKAPIDNPAVGDMDLAPGEFAIIWLWSDVCVEACKAEGTSIAASIAGRAPFPKFRDHYASLMGIEKYEKNPDGTLVNVGTVQNPEYVFTKEFQQIEDTLIVATHLDASLNLRVSTTTSTIYALVDVNFDPSAEDFILQGDASNPYTHNSKIFSFFGWGPGGSREIVGVVENGATIYVPSASKAELYHAYKVNENAEYDIEANYDYLKIGIVQSYLEMAVFSVTEEPTLGSMASYQWKYVDPEQMEAYAASGDTGYISDWEKSWDETTRNLAIQDATTGALLTDTPAGETEAAWMKGTIEALVEERVSELTDEDLDKPADERDETIFDQYWWDTMVGSNKKKNNEKDGMKTWVLIVIIVGAVLVAGGAAVAVVIIVKKKKKAAEAKWYAEHASELAADGDAAADDKKE